MELNLTITPCIYEKHDTLDINDYLYNIFNRQNQRKIDDNLVFYWIFGARIKTIIKNNIHITDPKGKPF